MRVVSTVEKVFGMEELLKNVPSKHTTDNLGRELRSLKDNQEELNRKLSDFDRQGFTSGGDTRRGNTDPSSTGNYKLQFVTCFCLQQIYKYMCVYCQLVP